MLPITPLFDNTNEKYMLNKDESLKRFFPSLWNAVSGKFQSIFPILTRELPDSKKFWNAHTKGLPSSVMLNNSNSPVSYILPAVSSKISPQSNVITVPFYIIHGFLKLSTHSFSGRSFQNKIVFNSPSDFKVLMWESKGLRSLLPEEDLRFAIMIHNIGHWVNYGSPVISKLLKISKLILPFLSIPLIIASIMISRVGERSADRFSKEVGYNKELAIALDRIGHYKRYDVSVINKIGDVIRVTMHKVHDAFDKYAPFLYKSPSVKSREFDLKSGQIKELQSYYFNGIIGIDEYVNELYEMDILEEGGLDFILNELAKFLSPIDRLAAKHAGHFFPLSQK